MTTANTNEEDPSLSMLQDVWTLYFHDPNDVDWNLSSYVRLGDISSVADYWDYRTATASYLSRGMFFVMREHVFPCWDDKMNINGGCLSMKVLKDDMPIYWDNLLVHMLGERLFDPKRNDEDGGKNDRDGVKQTKDDDDEDEDAWSVVNGLSVSPKRYFCIIKIWLRDEKHKDAADFRLPQGYVGEVLYKANSCNLKAESVQRENGPRHRDS